MTADEIDNLTIREVRAINERAADALKTLQQLGLAPMRVPISADANLFKGARIHTPLGPIAAPAEPYPCPACGRAGPIAPGESAGPTECLQCGNPTPLAAGAPGVRLTNKGPMVVDIEARNRLMASPAFDANGDPT